MRVASQPREGWRAATGQPSYHGAGTLGREPRGHRVQPVMNGPRGRGAGEAEFGPAVALGHDTACDFPIPLDDRVEGRQDSRRAPEREAAVPSGEGGSAGNSITRDVTGEEWGDELLRVLVQHARIVAVGRRWV